jgi:hypothetical protein
MQVLQSDSAALLLLLLGVPGGGVQTKNLKRLLFSLLALASPAATTSCSGQVQWLLHTPFI